MHKFGSLALPLMAALVASGALPFATRAPKPTITAADVWVSEGNNATLTLTLSQPATGFVFVEYRTAKRSAAADVDYVESSSFALFSAGDTQAVIQIGTLDDVLVEGDEVFTVHLHSSQANTPGGPVKVTIVDND